MVCVDVELCRRVQLELEKFEILQSVFCVLRVHPDHVCSRACRAALVKSVAKRSTSQLRIKWVYQHLAQGRHKSICLTLNGTRSNCLQD